MKRKIVVVTSIISTIILLNSYIKNPYKYKFLLFDLLNLRSEKVHIKEALCPNLQSKINELLVNKDPNNLISISVLNEKEQIIANYNGNTPRIPASNQKLISSAYTLSKLGPYYRLETSIYRNKNGTYLITGNGDPDMSIEYIDYITSEINNSYSRDSLKQTKLILKIEETPSEYWWPKSWTPYDKSMAYGAPLTKLAVTSNSNYRAISNPLERLKRLLHKSFEVYKLDPTFQMVDDGYFKTNKYRYRKIATIKSAPLYGLITLANSESHNFTSEILYRNAITNWADINNDKTAISWLDKYNVDTKGIYFADASGLSSTNRITTNALVALLKVMSDHKYSEYYKSSLSILGTRGTLANINSNNSLKGKFYGKSGTLTGVKSISGILYKNNNQIFISMISNNELIGIPLFTKVLSTILNSDDCWD